MTISTEVAGQMKYESVFAGHRCPVCGGEVREGIQEAIREDVPVDPLVGCSCFGKCQWTGRLSECVKVEDCIKALLAVNAHLVEFCDNGRPFYRVAVEAARRAMKDLDYVRRKYEWHKNESAGFADGLQKKIQEYERQIRERDEAINKYYVGIIQDARCERDEQIETVHKQNEQIKELKGELANVKFRLSVAKKTLARSSCEHSCMAVQDQVVEIQTLQEQINRLDSELSGQIAYKEQGDLVIQERNKTIQERDQEIKQLKGRVEVRERDLGVMSQDYLTAVLALQESKGPVGQTYRETIQQLHTGIQGHVKTIQERDAEIQRLKSQVEALKYEARIAKLNLKAGEEVILGRGETIQNQCTEIQRLKDRIGTLLTAHPLENWIKRAEKAEIELEKIKGYVRGVMVARRACQHGKAPDLLCASCGAPLEYSKEYDAHYCAFCHRWTEAKCEDPNCEFCSKRPEKPLN